MLTAYPIFQPVACVEADRQFNGYALPASVGEVRRFGRFKVLAAVEPDYADLKLFGTPSNRSSSSSLHVADTVIPPSIVFSRIESNNVDMATVTQRPLPSLASINNEHTPITAESSSFANLNKMLSSTTTTNMLEVPPSGISSTFPLRKVLSAPNLMNRFPPSVFEAADGTKPPRLQSFPPQNDHSNSNKRPIGDSSDSSADLSRTASPMLVSLQQQSSHQLSFTTAVASRLRAATKTAMRGVPVAHIIAPSADHHNLEQSNFPSSASSPALTTHSSSLQQSQFGCPPPKSHGRGWFSFLSSPAANQPILRHDEPSLSKDLDKLAASQLSRHGNSSRHNLQVIREDASSEFAEPEFAHQRSDVTFSQFVGRADGERSITPTQQRDLSATSSPSPINRGSRGQAPGGVAGFLTHLTNRLGVTPSESNTFAPSDL